jgi:hypothetical protein
LDEPAWRAAAWSEPFVDIEGAIKPAPIWLTRVKMLWDDTHFYFAAELVEPHVWGTLVKRDTIIYHDNDFEVFLDPDGDTHGYYELEINALGTVWDLLLVKPYRDGGPAVNRWDIGGLQSAVAVAGTANDPSDRDTSWTVELAIPWSDLHPGAAATEPTTGARPPGPPRDGEHWRVNFSRVQWDLEVVGDEYRKVTDSITGKPLSEHNWVWSPQGAVNMHMPEMWGIVQFSDIAVGEGSTGFTPPEDEAVRWTLRQVYYAQRAYFREHDRYSRWFDELGVSPRLPDGSLVQLRLLSSGTAYVATAPGRGGGTTWHISDDGRIWGERGRRGE